MPTVDEMFPSSYITAADLKGRAFQVTIQALSQRMLWDSAAGQERLKWILLFEEASKYLVLSQMNAKVIAQVLGKEDANEWGGAQIVIFPGQVQAVRIRAIAATEGLSTQEHETAGQAHSPRGTSYERSDYGDVVIVGG